MKSKLLNIFYLFFPLLLGGIVAFIIKDSMDYSTLIKPVLSPPKIIFPIVWTIIYLLLGLSFYLYKKDYNNYSTVDTVYYIGLFVNMMWSIIFFVWKLRFFSIIWILLLGILLITLLDLFKKTNKISYYSNIPYLVWIIFATYLTIGIYMLN